MSAQRLCHDSNFPIFPMEMKMLINEAEKKIRLGRQLKMRALHYDNSMLFFNDILVSTLFKDLKNISASVTAAHPIMLC